MYSYTTNWLNVEVNRNYTHMHTCAPLEPQPYQFGTPLG